eukprot:m.937279 g.937279  ORF g.937279 m.937279 type:complete len:202 (+) comp23814_c0_seq4:81-686(+)
MVANVPQGFAEAVRSLCTFPQDLLAEVAHEVIDFLSYKIGAVDTESTYKRLHAANSTLTSQQVQGAINALVYTFRDAVRSGLTTEALTTQLKDFGASVWSGKAVKVVVHVWGDRGEQACADAKALPQAIMHVGQLVGFRWKLAISVESSAARNLGRAFVALEMKVSDNSNRIKTHSFELSLYQFQNFAKQLREIHGIISEI